MQSSIEMTDKFILAINNVLKSKGDMTPMIEVTSQLKLVNLDYWERLIREEQNELLKSLFIEQASWLGLVSWDGYEREKSLKLLSNFFLY